MACITLKSGKDISCLKPPYRYAQRVVLVNRGDVAQHTVSVEGSMGHLQKACAHNIRFSLEEQKKGFSFTANSRGTVIKGSHQKIYDNYPQYNHKITMFLTGAGEVDRCLEMQINSADYFGALLLEDGTVEIYGFSNGLRSLDYDYDLQENEGIVLIELQSPDPEDDPPLIYLSDDPIGDFYNNFENTFPIPLADFNDDYNDDFFTV